MDAKRARELRPEIESALTDLGYEVVVGNARYNEFEVTFKLTLRDTAAPDKAQDDFDFYAPQLGLTAEDWHRVISYGGKQYRIIGIKPRSTKYPIMAERLPDKRIFKLPLRAVKAQHYAA